MKQLFLILALALVACKKEDPKPTQIQPHKGYASVQFEVLCPYSYMQLAVNWDSDNDMDTVVVYPNSKLTWARDVYQNSIGVQVRNIARATGDTSRIRIKMYVEGKVKYTMFDTVIPYNSYPLW